MSEHEQPRVWYFTFGAGQHGGFSEHHYVRIPGTFSEARAEMVRRFGTIWCGQYASAEEAGVEEYGLVEKVLR